MSAAVFHSSVQHVLYRGLPQDQDLPLEKPLLKPGLSRGCERGECILTISSSPGGYCGDEKTAVRLFSGAGCCEQRGSGGSWKHKHEPRLNKDACSPQCSKPIDHKSICVLYFSRLASVSAEIIHCGFPVALKRHLSFFHLQKRINLFPKNKSGAGLIFFPRLLSESCRD